MQSETLSTITNHVMEKLSATKTEKPCQKCKSASAETWAEYRGSYYQVCKSCGADLQEWEKREQMERRIAAVMPKRFLAARVEKVPRAIVDVVDGLPEKKGLFLWGIPGVGKTYAMCAFARHWIEHGEKVLRVNYLTLCIEIRDTFKKDSIRSEKDIVKLLYGAQKLIVEDVGVAVSGENIENDFSLRVFENLLNERNEHDRPTFITSNKSIEELDRTFDKRVTGRILEGCEILRLTGRDRRRI